MSISFAPDIVGVFTAEAHDDDMNLICAGCSFEVVGTVEQLTDKIVHSSCNSWDELSQQLSTICKHLSGNGLESIDPRAQIETAIIQRFRIQTEPGEPPHIDKAAYPYLAALYATEAQNFIRKNLKPMPREQETAEVIEMAIERAIATRADFSPYHGKHAGKPYMCWFTTVLRRTILDFARERKKWNVIEPDALNRMAKGESPELIVLNTAQFQYEEQHRSMIDQIVFRFVLDMSLEDSQWKFLISHNLRQTHPMRRRGRESQSDWLVRVARYRLAREQERLRVERHLTENPKRTRQSLQKIIRGFRATSFSRAARLIFLEENANLHYDLVISLATDAATRSPSILRQAVQLQNALDNLIHLDSADGAGRSESAPVDLSVSIHRLTYRLRYKIGEQLIHGKHIEQWDKWRKTLQAVLEKFSVLSDLSSCRILARYLGELAKTHRTGRLARKLADWLRPQTSFSKLRQADRRYLNETRRKLAPAILELNGPAKAVAAMLILRLTVICGCVRSRADQYRDMRRAIDLVEKLAWLFRQFFSDSKELNAVDHISNLAIGMLQGRLSSVEDTVGKVLTQLHECNVPDNCGTPGRDARAWLGQLKSLCESRRPFHKSHGRGTRRPAPRSGYHA